MSAQAFSLAAWATCAARTPFGRSSRTTVDLRKRGESGPAPPGSIAVVLAVADPLAVVRWADPYRGRLSVEGTGVLQDQHVRNVERCEPCVDREQLGLIADF